MLLLLYRIIKVNLDIQFEPHAVNPKGLSQNPGDIRNKDCYYLREETTVLFTKWLSRERLGQQPLHYIPLYQPQLVQRQ